MECLYLCSFCRRILLQLVQFFTSRGQLHDALLVAQVACEGGLSLPQEQEKKPLDLRKNDILPSLKNYMTDENKGLVTASLSKGIIGVRENNWKRIKRETMKGGDNGNRGKKWRWESQRR